MRHFIWTIVIAVMFGTACSAEQDQVAQPTLFSAQFSVADSVDQTGDYSGFQILIFSRQSAASAADTVFYGSTDSTGFVEGIINIEEEGAFPARITRNGVNLGALRLLLAFDDTVKITGQFPDFQNTYVVDSRESRAMKVYDRVEANYQRNRRAILAGQIADTLVEGELQKWSDLYWDVFNGQKGTFASKFALESMISLLDQIDRPKMFSRLNQSFDEDLAFGLAITRGKEFVADQYGIESAISYLDSVKSLANEPEISRAVEKSIIKINYDSSRVEEARSLFEQFGKKYVKEGAEPSFWYKNMRYELNFLAPGMPIPTFSIETTDGETVSNESMLGKAYVLEFTIMANQLYMSQYDEATVIYQLYNPQGLEYFTIPFDQSSNTIIAFFQERERYWELAEPPSFDQKSFSEDFNLQYFPTRILVDKKGNIVRKYVGEEFEDIIPAITQTLTSN